MSLGTISQAICNALTQLHADSSELSTPQLIQQFSRIVKSSSLKDQCDNNFASYFLKETTNHRRNITESLSTVLIINVLDLVLGFVTSPFEDREQEIIDSLFAEKKPWQANKNCPLFKYARRSSAYAIIFAITTSGVLNAETEYCFLVREFCRIHGEQGLLYFLSKCTPLPSQLACRKAVSTVLLLEAINMALEAMGKVPTRCVRSMMFCACSKFNGNDELIAKEMDDFAQVDIL